MWLILILVLPIVYLLYGYPNHVKYFTYFSLYVFLSTLVVVILCPYFLIRFRDPRNAALGSKILKYITKIYRLRWTIRNAEILAEDRGAVVVANHQSALDILGMYQIWEIAGKLSAVAKKEVMLVLPFGPIAYVGGTIFINRENPKSALKSLLSSTDAMVKNKTKIWIFPEGSRNSDLNKLKPFKKGAFIMAVAAQVPIIPVIYSPYYFIDHKKYIFKNGGEMIMKFLDPIPTTGLTNEDIPKLMENVYDIMNKEYQVIRKEVETKYSQ